MNRCCDHRTPEERAEARRRHYEILDQASKFLRENEERNAKKKRDFENSFHAEYALLPRKSSVSKKWLWLEPIYVRYEAIKKNYIEVTRKGGFVVTDPMSHYIDHQFRRGKALEVLSEVEFLNRVDMGA